jgi:hypothetical protein
MRIGYRKDGRDGTNGRKDADRKEGRKGEREEGIPQEKRNRTTAEKGNEGAEPKVCES